MAVELRFLSGLANCNTYVDNKRERKVRSFLHRHSEGEDVWLQLICQRLETSFTVTKTNHLNRRIRNPDRTARVQQEQDLVFSRQVSLRWRTCCLRRASSNKSYSYFITVQQTKIQSISYIYVVRGSKIILRRTVVQITIIDLIGFYCYL